MVAFAIEILFCHGVHGLKPAIAKRRRGSSSLMATKVFSAIMRELREVYYRVCTDGSRGRKPRSEAMCRDSGPLIVRNIMFRIMRRGDPPHVARALRAVALGGGEERAFDTMCVEAVEMWSGCIEENFSPRGDGEDGG